MLFTFNGELPGTNLGFSVDGAGDVNGDGFADVIVGARNDSRVSFQAGSAQAYSGVDGALLFIFDGETEDARLGWSVAGVGDVNRDGYSDIVVGAPSDSANGPGAGAAYVLSGTDGSILFRFRGESAVFDGDVLGYSVSGAGDVDGDGFPDVIVGGPGSSRGGLNSGVVHVFSGRDGAMLHTFVGVIGDGLGYSVSAARNADRDGHSDLIVGVPVRNEARLYSGLTGFMIRTFHRVGAFGASVRGAGDVDGDGHEDVIVGNPLDSALGPRVGSASVFSGANGTLLYLFTGPERFGGAVSGAGDVDNDGFADVAVGSAQSASGSSVVAKVFSGRTGMTLFALEDFSEPYSSVSGAGDVNADGLADIVVGTPFVDPRNSEGKGKAYVFSLAPDRVPPVITCPEVITVPCSEHHDVPVSFSATVTDECDPAPIISYSNSPGSGFAIGTTVVTVTAQDTSGNESQCSFSVIRAPLGFTGFLPPIGGADVTGGSFTDPLRTFKVNSTIPVKWRAFCGSDMVSTGTHTLQAIKWSSQTNPDPPIDATPTDAATTGNQFRLTGDEWHFNLDTQATGLSAGIWQLIATLSDSSQHSVWIQIK
ncbi:MAG: FG-GAP repeat protein [Verrucomicrobia bacterium]|nr:FG-GAP repeat protein [Verrucomicrobiota bacterium]